MKQQNKTEQKGAQGGGTAGRPAVCRETALKKPASRKSLREGGRRAFSVFLLLAAAGGGAGGCALKAKKPLSVSVLYDQALNEKQNKRYEAALKTLDQIRKNFPYSSFNPQIRLLLGDIHFEREKFKAAAEVYKRFLHIHPRLKRAEVLRKTALCYMKQLPSSADRDISAADPALEYFNDLLDLPGKNKYKEEAEKHIKTLLDMKAEKEFLIASFYIRSGLPAAAEGRLSGLIRNFPESAFAEEARKLLPLAKEKAAKQNP